MASVWQTLNGNCGACQNKCDVTSPSVWKAAGADVALDMTVLPQHKREVCTSLTTESTCNWKKNNLRAVQVTLDSENCNPSWVAPLWMTPSSETPGGCQWKIPQDSSGEIDIFERGCKQGVGFLLSYGSRDENIRTNAWGEATNPTGPTHFTALMKFHPDVDLIETWKCPVTTRDLSKLSQAELTAMQCQNLDNEHSYYARTKDSAPPDCLFHLVSDIWNKPGINAGCDRGADANTSCQFHLTGLKLTFQDSPVGAHWDAQTCKALLWD